MIKIIILICLTITQCFAIDITPIKKGDKASYDGFLISSEEMKKLRQINEEKKLLEQKSIKLQDLAIIKDQRIKLYQEEIEYNHKDLRKAQNMTRVSGVLGFLVGVAATGLASYVAIKVTK